MLSVTHLLLFSLAAILSEGGGSVSMHNPFYCFSTDPIQPHLEMFTSRTAYDVIRGETINANVSTCNPSKFWMISRHGTRLPSPADLVNIFGRSEQLHSEILSNYDRGRTSLCAADIELIRNWSIDSEITLERALYLSSSGYSEMRELAERYQSAFPSIFSSTYSPNDYFFRATNTHRTQQSLLAFAEGLFGENENVQLEDVPEQDFLLYPQSFCPLYSNVTSNNQESVAFLEGPEYQEMLTQVSAKLGFHGSQVLRSSDVLLLSRICEYDQIFDLNSTSPLCAAFSVANYEVLEYQADLSIYYSSGYGHTNYRRLFENMICFLIQDLMQFFESYDVNDHKARLFSGNALPVMLALVSLGAFEDNVPLTRHNFAQQTQRLWKTSLTTPMGNNLAVVRYE